MKKRYEYEREAPNPCPTCGKRFKCKGSNWKRQKFCSRLCMYESYRHGPEKSLAEFMAKVRKAESGCWLWVGAHNQAGYGLATWEGKKNQTAHRLSYRIHKGEIPEGLLVLHKCDTPPCVNPEHLFLGTKQDNADDKVAKGRQRAGEPLKRFKPDQVQAIRKRKAEGLTLEQVAAEFDTNYLTVWLICQRRVWKNVP